MLHLADAFGFTDVGKSVGDEQPVLDARCQVQTLIDLTNPDLRFTPKELADSVRRAANEIFQVFYSQLGNETTLSVVQRSIALVMPNSADMVVSFLAVTGLSMIACPLYPNLSTYEYKYAFKSMGVSLLIVNSERNPGAENAAKQLDIPCAIFKWIFTGPVPVPLVGTPCQTKSAEIHPSLEISPKEYEPCVKFHTAGYTARPKLTVLTHRNIVLSLANIQKTYAWKSFTGEETNLDDLDVGLCCVPLNSAHGLIASCLSPLAAQSVVAITSEIFNCQQFWDAARSAGMTWTTLTPSMLCEIMQHDSPKMELRFIRVTSQPLDPKVIEEAEQKLETVILEAYALTEAAHQICSNGYPTVHDRKPGSVGKPTGTEIAILDISQKRCCAIGESGEIWVRGYNVIEGYEDITPEEQKSLFMSHNAIDWMSSLHKRQPPAFYSAAFDLSPGVQRSFSTSIQSLSGYVSAAEIGPKTATPELIGELRPLGSPSGLRTPKPCAIARYASSLEPYMDQDFPKRVEPMISPLPCQIEWLRTGDVGFMDSDGYIFIIGRCQDVINRGGIKVSPHEIEAVFNGFPEIREAAAFGVKDPKKGEAIHIAVILVDEVETSDILIRDFRARAAEKLAHFKIPAEVHVVKALPKDTAGRLHRDALSSQFE